MLCFTMCPYSINYIYQFFNALFTSQKLFTTAHIHSFIIKSSTIYIFMQFTFFLGKYRANFGIELGIMDFRESTEQFYQQNNFKILPQNCCIS